MSVSRKTLHIVGETNSIAFRTNENLLDILNANKISINQACGANGSCTTCRIIVLEGLENLTTRTEIELERANERQFSDNERLACQVNLLESVTIQIPQFVT